MKLLMKNGTELKLKEKGLIKNREGILIYPEGESVDQIEKIIGTEQNLELVRYQTNEGITQGRFYNMQIKSITKTDNIIAIEMINKIVQVTIDVSTKLNEILENIENVKKEQEVQTVAITELSETVSGIETGQRTQDTAIEDLGQVVSDVMGGEQ